MDKTLRISKEIKIIDLLFKFGRLSKKDLKSKAGESYFKEAFDHLLDEKEIVVNKGFVTIK
jgi:hypothetical protein